MQLRSNTSGAIWGWFNVLINSDGWITHYTAATWRWKVYFQLALLELNQFFTSFQQEMSGKSQKDEHSPV